MSAKSLFLSQFSQILPLFCSLFLISIPSKKRQIFAKNKNKIFQNRTTTTLPMRIYGEKTHPMKPCSTSKLIPFCLLLASPTAPQFIKSSPKPHRMPFVHNISMVSMMRYAGSCPSLWILSLQKTPCEGNS